MTWRAIAAIVVTVAVTAGTQEMTDGDLERASAGRSVRVRTGATVVDLPLEVYVARVLAGEGEPRAAAAAQQALAIAVRTFAAANVGRHRRDGFDMCDTTHCQVLRPAAPAARQAALATASQLLLHEGRPAAVFYSASCGGRSEAASEVWRGAADLPYLRSADDDAHEGEESWVLDLPLTQVEKVLRGKGFQGTRLRDVEVERRSGSGRVTMLRLPGLRPDAISGEDFRAAIGARELRSTRFSLRSHGGRLRLTGRGYGHGVGLCVIGAGRRAARGESAGDILRQYYPGLRVEGGPDVQRASLSAAAAPVPGDQPSRARDLARRARADLSAALGLADPPQVRVEQHASVEAFRGATGRPWWVPAAVSGSVIELGPAEMLEQSRDGLEATVRRAVAEALISEALPDRPAWVRIGAARYYASTARLEVPPEGVRCPSDAELTMAVSAAAHRDAELRAEACFAKALAAARDWRVVR